MTTRFRYCFCLMTTVTVAMCAAAGAAGEDTSSPRSRPNVLFIMADDLNTALSGYGHPQCKTPNLDRLAGQGVSFTRAYCQFPVCGPSRASLMSGRYPLSNGVTRNGASLKTTLPTLPQLFREADYWTGRVSKIYHMGVPGNIYTGDDGNDHAASWIERYNVSVMESLTPGKAEDVMLTDSTSVYDKYRTQWQSMRGKGGRLLIKHGNHQGSDFVIVEADVQDGELADGAAANKAIELLQQRARTKQTFFLAVGFVRPHVPLVAPRRAFEGYAVDAMKLADVPDGDLDDMPAAAQVHTNERRYKLTPEAQRKALRGYYASISYMDEQVGRLLDALDELALRRNTIVVFVSDHGYHLGEHTMWQKMSLLEESIRVPLIVSAPGRKRLGQECGAVVELIDICPTLAELAGIEAPAHLQGHSFAALLDDAGASHGREDAFVQAGSHFCLRTERWAYMRYGAAKGKTVGTMMYDMDADPKQFTNLSGKPEYADIEKQLVQRLDERIAAAKASAAVPSIGRSHE